MLADEEKKETVRKHLNIIYHGRDVSTDCWEGRRHSTVCRKQRTPQELGVTTCGPVPQKLSVHAVFSIPVVALCKE